MRSQLVCAGVALLLLAGCGRTEKSKEAVAQVGNRFIDMKELERSHALQPRWKRGETHLGSYLTQFRELMVQKMYAQEAEKIGLDADSLLQAHFRFVKQKEMIKGLYRRQVREKVRVDEAEARRLYEWSKRRVDYEYIFCRDSARCASYGRELAGRPVGEIAFLRDSSVRAGKREATKVGDVPPELERLLFASRSLDLRGPVRMQGGYVVVKVTGGTEEKFLSENDFILERQKFENLLTERKADSLSAAYIVSLMQDKDLRLNAPVFWGVAEHFFKRVKEAHVDPMKIQSINVTSDELRLLGTDLNAMGDAVVATHREGSLTVRQLVEALAVMPGSLRPRARSPENLKAAIGQIVRNQFLLKEAERGGLDRDPEVLYEYGLQRDETLSMAYYERRRSEVTITPEEVEAFRKRSPVSEEQIFFKLNMGSLAQDAKADSMLKTELPRLESQYRVTCDTARIRSILQTPDAILNEDPVRMYVREIFQ
jgi:hypothetical protein